MILGEILRWNAKRHPNKTAFVFDGHRYTFNQFLERVNRLSNGFLRMDFKKGDRVALMAQNCHHHLEIFFAAAKVGLILVPINFRSIESEILYVMDSAGPRAFILSRDYHDRIRHLTSQMKSIEKYICLEQGFDLMIYYEDVLTTSSGDEPLAPVPIEENDDVMICYTSGATGNPKGVRLTHRNWISAGLNCACALSLTERDIALITVPLLHVAGIWPFMSHFYIGGSVVILRVFDPIELLKTIEKESITTLNLVPTHLIDLLEVVKTRQYNLSSLRKITYGAAPMPLEVLRRCTEAFGNIFMHIYGLTEAAGGLVSYYDIGGYMSDGDPGEIRRRSYSCGQEGINVEARVVNEEGEDVQPGEVGEIIVRGDCVMKGYWNLPEETSWTLRDGWLYTGDLATMDKDGYIFITDRKGFKIITGGENIYPKEVEDIIYQHPAVKEVVALGIPDNRWGEAVKAVIVTKEGAHVTEDEIIQFSKERMAGYKRPKSVDFVSELPKSSVGKILKKEIKKWYWK